MLKRFKNEQQKFETYFKQGQHLYQLGRYEKALTKFNKAFKANPNHFETLFYCGNKNRGQTTF
ncbi:hypothetical protein BGP_1340 [Beggiatoa sp. PS]|nr:hypothetical protein BGP_1340 [Beggiatoa sp. PS]